MCGFTWTVWPHRKFNFPTDMAPVDFSNSNHIRQIFPTLWSAFVENFFQRQKMLPSHTHKNLLHETSRILLDFSLNAPWETTYLNFRKKFRPEIFPENFAINFPEVGRRTQQAELHFSSGALRASKISGTRFLAAVSYRLSPWQTTVAHNHW